MDVPLLVDDFLRRAADLYPDKTAIVDGPQRFRYRDWRARVNQLSHALLGLGVRPGRPRLHPVAELATTSSRASTPPARSGRSSCPSTTGCCRRTTSTSSATPASGSPSWTPPTRRRSTRSARASRRPPLDRDPGPGRRDPAGLGRLRRLGRRRVASRRPRSPRGGRRRRLAQLHLGHHRAAQGRDADPPQLLPERLQPDRPPRPPPRGRRALDAPHVPLQRLGRGLRADRAWAAPTSCCARSTPPRSSGLIEREGVTFACMAPAVLRTILDYPDRAQAPHHHAAALHRRRRAAAGGLHRAPRARARLRVPPDLRPHRDRAAAHRVPPRPRDPRPTTGRAAPAPACPGLGVEIRAGRRRRRAGAARRPQRRRGLRALERRLRGLLRAARGDRARRSATAGSTPATSASGTRPGSIHIVDRKKDVIISGGENISSPGDRGRPLPAPGGARVRGDRRPPREVGRDAEGAGRAAPRRDAANEAELIAFCRERLAHFKCPTSVELVDGAAAHRDRKAAEVRAAGALLARPRAARELSAGGGGVERARSRARGSGSPAYSISNEELVASHRAAVARWNEAHAAEIAAGRARRRATPRRDAFIVQGLGHPAPLRGREVGRARPGAPAPPPPAARRGRALGAGGDLRGRGRARRWRAPGASPATSTPCSSPARTCSAPTPPSRSRCSTRSAPAASPST